LVTYTHRWRLRRVLPQQFGKLCRIVPQDYTKRPGWKSGHAQPWGMVDIEFQDGTTVRAHRAAIRPIGFLSNRNTPRGPRKFVG
jgi:hypothetical protein